MRTNTTHKYEEARPRWPVDHNDAFTKLDEVPEGQSEAPGQLLDAGEGLDSWLHRTAALLLLFKTYEKLQKHG